MQPNAAVNPKPVAPLFFCQQAAVFVEQAPLGVGHTAQPLQQVSTLISAVHSGMQLCPVLWSANATAADPRLFGPRRHQARDPWVSVV